MGARPSSFVAEVPVIDETPALPARVWSAQQQAIFDWFAQGTGNLVVRARAGTGKTTTILEGVTRAPEELICVCAYNARIARTLKERLTESNAMAATLHSLGYQAIKRVWGPKVAVDEDRARRLTDLVCPPKIYSSTRRNITKLHTIARETMPHCTEASELIDLAIACDCVLPGEDPAIIAGLAFQAMLKAQERSTSIDFADMIYLALRLGMVRPRFDLIVVDECQDMSEPQLEIALALLRPDGRMVVVGDDRQAIYGFRGADSGSLDRLKSELNAAELGLTMTYRCGSHIVAHAQEIVPDIQALPNAHTGFVGLAHETTLFADVQPGDFILSRVNAALVRTVMALLRDGRRARIEGKDIGKMLLGLHQRMSKWGEVRDLFTWEANLDQWAATEIRRAESRDLLRRVETVKDTVETLRTLAEGANDTEEITVRITHLFADDISPEDYIIGSTVHKAKGLEADRVWLLADTFNLTVECACGHRHGRDRVAGGMSQSCGKCDCARYVPSPAALMEEENIRYVAITRAKNELRWVSQEGR